MTEGGEKKKSFDVFELFVAILLGAGAIGGAWASYQGGLWGGKSQELMGQAATEATRASTLFNLGVTSLVRDLSLDIDAKKLIVEAIYAQQAEDQVTTERTLVMASYLYAQQMSDEGYRVLGLPAQWRTEEGRGDAAHIPIEQLAPTLERELAEDETYIAAVLGGGTEGFAESDRTFERARQAGGHGDEFGMIGILFTVALFLSGIALVFKSKVKWAFAGIGLGMLVVAGLYLFRTPWAGSAPPEPSPAPAAEDAAEPVSTP